MNRPVLVFFLLNRSLDTTFLLSGWSKGDSIAEVESKCDETTDKFWGIIIKLKYSDETTEEQYLPFNEFIHDWQYASMAVVPKKKQNTAGDLKIESATVRVCYYNNANTAYFDNISLTEEPAQTYVYDEKGNLTSVKSTGNGSEGYKYDNTTENLLEVATAGSGTYAYEYKNANNKYLPTKVSNDGVSMNIAYDQYGEATSTTLVAANNANTFPMLSTAKYENGLLTEQTDNTGAKTLYTYDKDRDCVSVKNANQQEIKTKKKRSGDIWIPPGRKTESLLRLAI